MVLWVNQSKGDISDFKGLKDGKRILAKIGKNLTKMAITSVVCDISIQSLV